MSENGMEQKYVKEAFDTNWVVPLGPNVNGFEADLEKFVGQDKKVVALSSGTAAVHLSLIACGVKAGDEVLVQSFTFCASSHPITYLGATPVFVDSEKESWNIDPDLLEEAIIDRKAKTGRLPKAISPVALYGMPYDIKRIMEIGEKYGIPVIEDAAEAHGATWNGRKAGSCSHVGCFSFFANKNVTTGEGGMVVTNDEAIYQKLKYYKNVCFPIAGPRNYLHNDIGFNYRMSNVVAAIGLAQTEKADEYKAMRMHNNVLYRHYLTGVPGIRFQSVLPEAECVSWMNTIVIDPMLYGHTKDELVAYLKGNKVDTRLLFNGMHRQKSLQDFGCDCSGDYPVCDWLTQNGFYLPSASSLTEETIKAICELIINFQK